jgi:formate dehydrogenase
MGRFATLSKYLIEVLNIVTGRLDRPGGVVFSRPMIDAELFTALFKLDGYDRWRSRVDAVPEVFGTTPLACFAREVLTPGKGQLRAFLGISTNLATTSPNSAEMERALAALDLYVSLDPYITESNRHAHYILPPKLLLEREGFPIFGQLHYAVPNAQWTDELVTAPPEARDDWWIIDQICKRIRLLPSPAPGAQLMGRLGLRLPPHVAVDVFMRLGKDGDLFGLRRRGISRRKLLRTNGAIQLAEACPTGVLRKRLRTKSKRVELAHPVMAEEMARLIEQRDNADPDALRLFTIRENRSQNSWLHNVPSLLGDRTALLRIHPTDALARAIGNGDPVTITSATGSISAKAAVTDEVIAGSVGLAPHFGHQGGWRTANAAGGGRYNDLTSNDAALMDRPSGNAWLNGITVTVHAAVPAAVVLDMPVAEVHAGGG